MNTLNINQLELDKMKNLLIVEDESIIAKDYQLMIERSGHHVVKIVNNGKDAVETAVSDKPDFILMDINIKGKMNGIEAAQKIHELHVPAIIIFITAYDVNSYTFPQFDHYLLNKPLMKQRLLNILNN